MWPQKLQESKDNKNSFKTFQKLIKSKKHIQVLVINFNTWKAL